VSRIRSGRKLPRVPDLPPVLSLLSLFLVVLVGLASLAFLAGTAPAAVRRGVPRSRRRPALLALLAGFVAVATLGYACSTLLAIRRCEAHDDCADAPAWVGDGLHELQKMDGGCVYRPEGCPSAGPGANRAPDGGAADGDP
jgi:hypothetical protein